MFLHAVTHTRISGALVACGFTLLLLAGGCASSGSDAMDRYEPRFTREYKDSTPLEAVDSLLFAYREGDYGTVYFLTKTTESQSDAGRKAFMEESRNSDAWTPALWEIDGHVAYTGDKNSADVTASVLSDLEGVLYNDSMRFYCFLDNGHWKIAQHTFEGESVLLGPADTVQREPIGPKAAPPAPPPASPAPQDATK